MSFHYSVDLMVEFDPAIYSGIEGEQVSIIVVLNIMADRDVTVNFNTINGSATGKFLLYTYSLV